MPTQQQDCILRHIETISRLIARLRDPRAVQAYLNALRYNQEPGGRATLRSFRGVVREGCAHCLEAALFAALYLSDLD